MLYILDMGLTAKDVIKELKANGWRLIRVKGSHHIFDKEGVGRLVVVPVHGNRDLGDFAVRILKEAGLR